MVKLKVTARVIPEAAYNNVQTSTPAGRKFLVIVRDPDEFYYVGTLAHEIQAQYQRLYKHELGKVKYIKDEQDNDLDPEQLVLDVFVNEGKAERDGLDQDATISIIQDQRQALRAGSVVPDLTPVHYLPRPRPPIPRFQDVPSSLGKRLRESDAIQETPGQNKRSRDIEIAQTQDDNRMLRSIERSPELVHDTQGSGIHQHVAIDQDGNRIKAESPTLRRSLRDIEPATADELEWLSERPHAFVSPQKRRALQPKVNGPARGSDNMRNSPASRHSRLPITPPTDPSHLGTRIGRNQSNGSPMHQALSTSGSRFKKSARRNLYDLPVESDIEDSQMPVPDQPAMIPRLVKNMPTIGDIPNRQSSDRDIAFAPQESLQTMEIDQGGPSVPAQESTNPATTTTQDDDSDDDANVTYTSAKASTTHETASEKASTSSTGETTTSEDESESEDNSSTDSPTSVSGNSAAPTNDNAVSTAIEDEDEDESHDSSSSSQSSSKSDEESESESVPASVTQKDLSNDKSKAAQDGKATAVASEKQTLSKAMEKASSNLADQHPNAEVSAPVKRKPGRPRKSETAPTTTATKKTPATQKQPTEMVDTSVQTKNAKRGPMSKLVNEASRRRDSGDLDSPGEQLSQSLQESTKVVSILETTKGRNSVTSSSENTDERRPSDASATSTPTRDRIGLGITDSPRKTKSISVEIPAPTNKLSFAQKMEQMRRSSSVSGASPTRALDSKGKSTTLDATTSPGQKGSARRRRKLRKLGTTGTDASTELSSETTNSPVTALQEPIKAPPSASKGPILPPGMTLEQYNAIMSQSNITEAEYQAQKALKKPGKARPRKSEQAQLPEVVVSVENNSDANVPPPSAATAKTPRGRKPKTDEEKNRLSVTKAAAERATSSPAADQFAAITARLNSLQPSDKGSMPPPDRKNTLKKQSSTSTSGSDINGTGSNQSAVSALYSTVPEPTEQASGAKKPAAATAPSLPSKKSEAAPKQATATKKTPTPSASAPAKKATTTPAPTPLATKLMNGGQPTSLKALKAQVTAARASQNASPAPSTTSAKRATGLVGASRLKIGNNDNDESSDDDDSSDDDSESSDEVGKPVAKKAATARLKHVNSQLLNRPPKFPVDASIRDQTSDEDSDSE